MIKLNYIKWICIATLLLITSCSQSVEKPPLQKAYECDGIKRDASVSLSKELASFSELTKNKTGVYILEDGGGSLVARAWFCEYAEKTIDIQYFIFSTDNVGLIACDFLVRAADRGVKIRLLVDDIMVEADLEDILTLDSHENIDIKIYNPGVNLGKNIYEKIKKFAFDFRSANQRMHNKTFIVDGQIVITGGRNIADEYFDYDHEYNFRDRDVLLLGKTTQKVQHSFNEFWNYSLSVPVTQLTDDINAEKFGKDPFEKLHEYACNPDNFWPQVKDRIENLHTAFQSIKESNHLIWVDRVDFVSDKPGKNDETNHLGGGGLSTDALVELVENAEHSIDIQSPYLITTEPVINLFKKAVQRGVNIRILTNSLASTDNIEAFSGYQRDRELLLETGIRIFEFRPDAAERYEIMTGALQSEINFTPIFGLHAKTMVIDEKITVIGTFNLDPRSANLNTECMAIIHSENVAKAVLKGMEVEFKPENSWETTLTFNPDSKVSVKKRFKTWTRILIPKDIL